MDSAAAINLPLGTQLPWVVILALPVACIAWTVTHEEIFREAHDYCVKQSRESRWLLRRKVFYALICEYCFSHYVTAFFLAISQFQLLLHGWRGYIIAGFAIVW